MSKYKIYFLIFCIWIFSLKINSQTIVVSPTMGCVPLVGVNYTSPAGATSILWNFGDGITSSITNPMHNYTNAGNYIITFNGIISGSPITYTALVKVFPKPVANFNFALPAVGCAVRCATFTNLSTTTGGATISSLQWSYGDGGSATFTGNTNIYCYTLPGSFSVTLKATDSNGCDNTTTIGTINVSAPPNPVIIATPGLNSCTAPFTTSFNGNTSTSGSPLGGGLTYSWNFGNTQTSTQATPGNITYAAVGNYNVTLTVTDNNNCSNSTSVPASVSQPSVLATIPGTVCYGKPLIIVDNSNVPVTFWNFGDGFTTFIPTSTASQTVHTYAAPGVYSINITATSGTCSAVLTKTILVQQVVANFTFTPASFTCAPTMTAQYTNLSSSNATIFNWTATNNNGTTLSSSNLTNPTFTLVQGSLNPYTIYGVFASVVSLTATSAFGCVSIATINIFDSIRRPTAWFNKDKKEGCAPLVVKFRDSSFTNTSIYPITSYTWNNGAIPATIISGNIPPPMVNPTFTYSAPGTYTPFLIVQTASGCTDISFIDTVTVVNPPTISFNVSPPTVCWNQPVTITNTSPSFTAVQHWHVESDNGFFSHCVNNANPSWNFTHVGVHTFSMSGYLHSCKGSAVSTQSVTVLGPIVQGRYQTNCNEATRKTVVFASQLQNAQYATLNYGDGSPTFTITGNATAIVANSVSHTYTATGNYTATLIGVNALTGCLPYTYTMLVTVRDVQANFTLPSVACSSVMQTFNGSSSVDVLTGCGRGYVWFIDNLPPNDTISPTVHYNFTTAGTHTVLLMVKDMNGCCDTTKKTFRISSANPSFAFSTNTICLSSGTLQLINTTSQTPDPITNYVWDFGDGTATSTFTSPTHTYASATVPNQIFTITLVATNSQGCTDAKTHTLQVNNPNAQLFALPQNTCVNIPINFNAPSGYPTYTFNYGANTQTITNTSGVTIYSYSVAGTYTAVVTIQDAGGCKNSSSAIINIQSYPTASFSFTNANATGTNNICSGSPVTFINTSTSAFTLTPSWNLGTGSPVIPSSTVVNIYTTQGVVVPITLTVSTSYGCKAVVTKTLIVYGAKANLNLDKITVCLGKDIKFNVKDSATVFAWIWDFGDGTTSPTITANSNPSTSITHNYTYYQLPNGTTTVSLTYYSAQYSCSYTATQPIQVIKIDADFKRNAELAKPDSIHCLGLTDIFTNTSVGSSGFAYNWYFGNGSSSTASNPNYIYPISGIYQVTLAVIDVNGCKGNAVKNMTINPLPTVKIFNPDSICKDVMFNLFSIATSTAGIASYSWSPSAGLASPNSPSTTATASVSPQYTLDVIDLNGCRNSTTSSVYIQEAPNNLQWDTTIIIGQTSPINNVYAGINMSYTWSPPIDLNCNYCVNPISTSTNNITYTVTVADNLGCFRTLNTYTINVEPKSSVDVPTAFTPNGDGTNDIIYVDGWGIRKLNYFRIFNRWGQLLFESNDIKVGWNGYFNSVPQNMETYVYQVSAETYIDEKALLKTGTFKLIR